MVSAAAVKDYCCPRAGHYDGFLSSIYESTGHSKPRVILAEIYVTMNCIYNNLSALNMMWFDLSTLKYIYIISAPILIMLSEFVPHKVMRPH